ncbi:MAG: amino acid ABC transporter permease [Propionibacteriaceae bacterium]|jgi:polar amino acid transport system permease protein|nr:amino acid ABC transporter permease [Propionibacteriaceae bacterium]
MALSDIRPTVRRRISWGISLGVALILVIAVAWFAVMNWDVLGRQFFNGEVAAKLFPDAITVCLRNTLLYTIICFVIGTFFAMVLALMKMSRGPLRWFAIAFIEVFRGLPAMLTIFAFAFMVPMVFQYRWPIGGIFGGLIGLVCVTAAYNAEVIRSGLEAVPRGQREAARSLGMSIMTTNLIIILPQGLRIVIPPLTNEFVMLLKDTALLFIAGASIGMRELTTFGRDGLTTYSNGTPMIVAGVLYLIVTIPLTYLVGRLEKRMAVKK